MALVRARTGPFTNTELPELDYYSNGPKQVTENITEDCRVALSHGMEHMLSRNICGMGSYNIECSPYDPRLLTIFS
jgi:hypothetical protein